MQHPEHQTEIGFPKETLRSDVLDLMNAFKTAFKKSTSFKEALTDAYFEGFLDPLSEIYTDVYFSVGEFEFALAGYEYREDNDQQLFLKRRRPRDGRPSYSWDEEVVIELSDELPHGFVSYSEVILFDPLTQAALSYKEVQNNEIAFVKTREILSSLGCK